MLTKFYLLLICFLLSGCSNYCAKNYKDLTNGLNISDNPNLEISKTTPKMIQTSNHDETVRSLKQDGHLVVGYSTFVTHGGFSEKYAIEQAQNVKASVVVFQKTYRNTVSTSIPLMLPTTATSYSSFSGYGGGSNFYGTGKTTTYGTTTTYIPTTDDYYDYFISFWVKQKLFRLGIEPRELTENEKKITGSNKGVAIYYIVKNTPAYQNDLLADDIIKRIDNDVVIDVESFNKLLIKHEGNVVNLSIIRNGQVISKFVKLNKSD